MYLSIYWGIHFIYLSRICSSSLDYQYRHFTVTAHFKIRRQMLKHKEKPSLICITADNVFLNAISVYPSVPVKAPFLPGGHLQATLPLSSPSCRASVQLIPKDRLQRPRENHWVYLIQHWINLLPLWEGNKAQFGPGGMVRARREVPCTSSV